MNVPELTTPRLRLRGWRAADREPFAAMSADPEVMRHFPAPLTRAESDALVTGIGQRWREQRLFGWWAVELPGEAPFIGFAGLNLHGLDLPGMPPVEIGWRLARPFWGRGLATEAARACLTHAFRRLWIAEICAFTAVGNLRSRTVMERLGMRRDGAGDCGGQSHGDGYLS